MIEVKASNRRYNIGEVVFRDDGTYVTLMFQDRLDALRKFYRKENLESLEPFVFGVGPIQHSDVRWDSAGHRVTGNA